MYESKPTRLNTAFGIALLAAFIWCAIWERWHESEKSVPVYFAGLLVLLAIWNIRSIYIAYQRKLLAQLVVSSCALAVLPSFLIAPIPLERWIFWMSAFCSLILLMLSESPLHLLDM